MRVKARAKQFFEVGNRARRKRAHFGLQAHLPHNGHVCGLTDSGSQDGGSNAVARMRWSSDCMRSAIAPKEEDKKRGVYFCTLNTVSHPEPSPACFQVVLPVVSSADAFA